MLADDLPQIMRSPLFLANRAKESFEGRRLIKATRQQVLEARRPVLEKFVEKHTGATVVSIHSDISTESGEWLDAFVLDRQI